MAYCTKADIKARFQGVDFDTDTIVTGDQVDDFITMNSELIDGQIGSLYETPVTSGGGKDVLKRVCIQLTVADVEDVLTSSGDKDEKESRAQQYRKAAKDTLEKIEKQVIHLKGATSKYSKSFVNSNVNDDVNPTLKRGKTQW